MANGHGGARPGAGRPKGSVNRLVSEAVEQAKAGGRMPLEHLLGVMRDPAKDTATRLEAAKAAAPYCHPRLAQVEARNVNVNLTHEEALALLEADGDVEPADQIAITQDDAA
ncbi:MAG: hypothetical protein KDA64_11610 [Rhodospirillaceae bacterium]|nr:hypothetical protein [Rhodospirillaceae bacterium]